MLLAVADAAAESDILVFNAGATDDALRMEECRANVIHVAPSRAMLADALAQYLVWKKWTRWFLIVGSHEADEAYADGAPARGEAFGAEIVEERVFEDTGGARTTDSGTVQVQRQMPVFTQEAPDHHVVVVADESEVFGAYVPFRTWTPAPVAGTDGLRPTSWSPAHDQWGAIQLQNRFVDGLHRLMTEKDIAVLDGGAHDRRGGDADEQRRSGEDGRVHQGPGLRGRRLQGPEADAARLGPAAAPADPARRRPHGRLGLAAGGLSAPDLGARHARLRPAGDAVQLLETSVGPARQGDENDEALRRLHSSLGLALAAPAPAFAYKIFVSNEGDNTISVIDSETHGGDRDRAGRPAPARHHHDQGRQVRAALRQRRRHRADHRRRDLRDRRQRCPPGPDPELFVLHPSGNPLYIANEDDNLVTVVDVEKRSLVAEIPVGVEPEGMGISPDGKVMVNTSETTSMAHFIDTATNQITHNVLVDTRPRFAEFKKDGSEVWVSAEIGGTVSVIDTATHEIKHKITFEIAGLRPEAIQPVGVRITKDGKTAFVALGPANRVAVVNAETYEVEDYLLVGQRVWQLGFSPDESLHLLDQRRLQRRLGHRRGGARGDEVHPGRTPARGASSRRRNRPFLRCPPLRFRTLLWGPDQAEGLSGENRCGLAGCPATTALA